MKKILYFLITMILLNSCEESELTIFDSKDALYFDFNQNLPHEDPDRKDSINYSFGALDKDHPDYLEKDTVWCKLRVQGNSSSKARKLILKVDESLSTAIVSTHYEALLNDYILPADSLNIIIPFILFNDESLGADPIYLVININENENFDIGVEGQQRAKIKIYDEVTKPPIWDQFLYRYFGPYSLVKHKLILELNGGISLPTTYDEFVEINSDWSIWYWGNWLYDYLMENEIRDENGDIIEPY